MSSSSAKFPHFTTVGEMYHDFQLIALSEIGELHCRLLELIHVPTGARVMAILNNDPENLFCLSFQTIPDSSNGVAHILEHTVLCGSKKFPVKDPFFAMQRRSLNTFMNALTGADFTCYPAASQVTKDFYNLLDVYLDAVFHPTLDELSFLQEGHRLEFADPADPQSPLEYKGIVFNEMKGALGSPSARLTEAMNHALFPDLTYGINSGGDPKVIPTLTYSELREFHEKYYHPSRCLFFFYGNLPLEGHLDFIAEHVLNKAQAATPIPPLPLQPRFSAPKRLVKEYPIAADEETQDKTQIAFGWLTCHILEQVEILALTILEIILMDTDASPLKLELLKSGLCKQVGCYMEDELSEVPLILFLKGCNPQDADSIEELIRKTLKEFAKEGVPPELFENAIHQLEFHRSEITGDGSPFGLSLFMRSALLKQHGGEPTNGLHIHTLFDEVRRRHQEDPHYLTGLVTKYFIDNPHMVRIVMVPSKELAAAELAEEKGALAAIESTLSEEQRQIIVDKAAELAAFQAKQEDVDLDILPKVTLADIPHAPRFYSLEREKIGNIEAFHHETFTNGIVYADLFYHFPQLSEEELSYVSLLSSLMGQMGCGGRSYIQNLEYIQAYTGGVGSVLSLNTQASDHNLFFPALSIRGKALHRNVPHLLKLLQEMANSVDFSDVARLKEIIVKQYTSLQGSLNQNALRYAINLSSSGLDVHSKIANSWYGLEYFWRIKRLVQEFDQHADALIAKLKVLYEKIFTSNAPDLIITCDRAMYKEIKGHRFYGLQDISGKPFSKWQPNYPVDPGHSQGRVISSPIAFNGKVLKTVSYTDSDAAALNIAAFLCDNLTLHTAIREKGGAYGGGAVSNLMSGIFYFYSYRDPNIVSTFDAFDESVQKLQKGEFTLSDIEEAKLEMIQALDTPVAPGSRGVVAYGWLSEGKDDQVRTHFRERVLKVNSKGVIDAINRHVIPKIGEAVAVSFAGKEMLEKENLKFISQGKKPLPIESI